MKGKILLSHPYTFIVCFLFIIISGEHWGGFYATYILTALMHGGIYAVLAVLGIAILVYRQTAMYERRGTLLGRVLGLEGFAFMLSSIILFFWNDRAHYNRGTFEQGVPVFTLCLAALVGSFFLINLFTEKTPNRGADSNHLVRV